MMWRTHVLCGINALWLLAPLPPEILQANMGILAAAAALGAPMPDLDASESKIKHLTIPSTQFKPFLLPALMVSKTDQHRGLLHSLTGLGMMALFAIPTSFYGGWAAFVAFLLGYASHLIADSATKSGISLFYPRLTRYYLLPTAWRITTGSLAEEVLMAPLASSVLLLLVDALR